MRTAITETNGEREYWVENPLEPDSWLTVSRLATNDDRDAVIALFRGDGQSRPITTHTRGLRNPAVMGIHLVSMD